MKASQRNLVLLGIVFGISLVVANMVTAKTIDTGIPLFGSTIMLPGAAVCYAISYLMTDVVGEIWGRKEAQLLVNCGFAGQVVATLLVAFTQMLPAADPSMQQAYDMLLGQNWMFVTGSMVAYLASQSWDVLVFHRIRDKVIEKTGSTKHRWIWNNLSTMTSQAVDTVLFIGIAFGLGFGWLFDGAMLPQLGAMMVGQYILKFALALFDTPFFYLMTRNRP